MKDKVSRGRTAVLLAALAVTGAIAAYTVLAASADGRSLQGAFCATSTGNHFCISLTWNGVEYGTNNRADLALRPGTYWITVNDNSPFHNFALRSCPDATSSCETGDGSVQELTTIPDASGEVTTKILLQHGTYRLFCAAAGHESAGMYVDFEVGGEGQVG
jgi:uncharacterized cupredoxin-like copper-binding protein